MLIKTKNYFIDHFAKYYKKVFVKIYCKRLRNNLSNDEFSLFSPNCYAGIIYHRLNVKFQSPTINMLFPSKKKYVDMLENLEFYMNQDLKFYDDSKNNCPTALLGGKIPIIFNHYKTEQEAKEKWYERRTRVNYDRLFFIYDDIGDSDIETINRFLKIPYGKKVVLTAKKYPCFDNIVTIDKYYRDNEMMKAYLLELSPFTGLCPADKNFNYVEWINDGIKK